MTVGDGTLSPPATPRSCRDNASRSMNRLFDSCPLFLADCSLPLERFIIIITNYDLRVKISVHTFTLFREYTIRHLVSMLSLCRSNVFVIPKTNFYQKSFNMNAIVNYFKESQHECRYLST